MNRKQAGMAALLVAALTITAGMVRARTTSAAADGDTVYAQVVIWDVAPSQAFAFQQKLHQQSRIVAGSQGFINDRSLRNIDSLTFHYATYTKSTDITALQASGAARIRALRSGALRDPEVHDLVLTSTYWGAGGGSTAPTGDEYDRDAVGQVAHLGVFVPFTEFRSEYDRTLDHVKVFTRDGLNQGYIGEDVLDGLEIADPEVIAPYTPRPLEPARVSINYGEYETLEDAENAYIARGADRPTDPQILAWERIFYGSLQVPTRFYIFRVIDSVRAGSADTPIQVQLSR